ncbi:MFS transporter [Pseudosulfitobacter sp. DSM 107133]|uniref:MFS transporter n=1 Tax=Pseudosulfitobacter sp. DSM 107133 TaxID=2883100 RepID=UPI000DF2D241|nr:MFS transporter [Pseudosulfitobacter sp. DSM 107133]UOA25820.1 Riboflavin transporter RfnT [Pseudosulfitobacter sp. DSM 107133]
MSVVSLVRNGNLIGLLVADAILAASMPILIILGGLAGLMLAPTTALATLPASLQTLAWLFAAAPFSLLMGKLGRKAGFIIGAVLTIVGALVGTWALMSGSFFLLCAAHLVLGIGLTSHQYFRFAAAEVVSKEWRPVAISLVLTSGLIAAFGGPQIFIMTKDILAPVPLAGGYAAIAGISLVGILPLLALRIPIPPTLPRVPSTSRFASLAVLRRSAVRKAVLIGAISQGAMMFMMVPTTLAMIGCGFSEGVAGDVIRWHVVAMFAPSFFTGFLIKRFSATPVVTVGLGLLALAAISGATGLSAGNFYGALALLGAGWNFSYIGATDMLAEAVTDDEKSVVQGVNDTMIALVSTICAFASGAVIAGLGWIILSAITLVFVALSFAVLVLDRRATALPSANANQG